MKECRALEQRLTLYVLGELDRKGESEIEAHFAECSHCREDESLLRREVHRLKAIVGTELRAPAGLMEKVELMIQAEQSPARRIPFRLVTWAASFAAIILIAFLMLRPGQSMQTLDLLAADSGSSTGLMAGTPTPTDLAMLSKKVGFDVKAVPLGPKSKISECGPSQINGVKAAKLVYQLDGKRVVFYQLPMSKAITTSAERRMIDGKSVYVASRSSTVAIGWRCDDCLYVIIAEASEAKVLEYAMPLIAAA